MIPSSDEWSTDASHHTDLKAASCSTYADALVELLRYIDDIHVFVQRFNEHADVHDIKMFLASLEQRAHQRFQFLFHRLGRRVQLPSETHSHFPLRFGEVVYGTLCVMKQIDHPDVPAFPLNLAAYLALSCGWLLYTCEQSMFVWSYHRPEFSTQGSLTKREREVLTLMCRGYQVEEIARMLTITTATVIKHKQHIYEQLGVHNVRDALHASYHSGLVSFIDELYE
jgi:DNA-binding CsgD family transcriptional regulator